MLPDQSHVRTEDWTVFLLYHQHGHSKLEYHIQDEGAKSRASKLYVLNLVNTKFDQGAKRGAIVKAMCIVTPHPFFHVFKPLLLLALDEYFKYPSQKCLQNLYESINSIDLSRVPQLNYFERQILASSDQPNMFSEKFEDDGEVSEESARKHSLTTLESQDEKAAFYIDLKSSGGRLLSGTVMRDTHFYECKVNFNGMRIPIKVPVDVHPESVGEFSVVNLVTSLLNMTVVGDIAHPELTTYGTHTPALLILINGLLTQKRVLFVGLNTASGEVADRVLAACSLASGGLLQSFVTNAFPYTDLSKVDDLLSSPGYIAGVKNPAFGHHPSWWDILIDLEAGTLMISSSTGRPSPPTKESRKADAAAFMNPEDVAFLADLKCMIVEHFKESTVRDRSREYIKRFVRIATSYEQFKYGATQLWAGPSDAPAHIPIGEYGYTWVSETQQTFDFQCYAPVIEGWRKTRSYRYYIADQRRVWPRAPKRVIDYEYLLDKLRFQKLTGDESAQIYKMLGEHVKEDGDVLRLLTASSVNNLFYISLGMFHSSALVRAAAVRVLARIEKHAAGRHFYAAMSGFQKMAYTRMRASADMTGS